MVTKIPKEFDTEAKIANFFEERYPKQVAHVEVWFQPGQNLTEYSNMK